MIDTNEFRQYGHRFVEWIAEYYENIEKFPVKSQVKLREIYEQLPASPPDKRESIDTIFEDFVNIVLPGMTHWQSPDFFAYFPANTSFPSILAEMLTAALGAQCMKWETSPAAAELEEVVMKWLIRLTGLPESFSGVIQDSASTSTLCALLSARERASHYQVNNKGFYHEKFRIYCSTEAHSSVEKAVKIAGIGKKNLVKIGVDENFSILPDQLERSISEDKKNGFQPLCVVAAIGTTSSTAVDPLLPVGLICKKHKLWLHVDAAFAGSALILPEYRKMIEGIENVDSFVFNPHKWLFTNFDCSAYFVKDKDALVRTFHIMPEYLRTTTQGEKNDYCDWGIPLGRRFRALKLWFVLRNFGRSGLQEILARHISLTKKLKRIIEGNKNYEILAPVFFNLICFRYLPENEDNEKNINAFNEQLLEEINASGKLYLSHTRLRDKFTLRVMIAQTYVKETHVMKAWEVINNIAVALDAKRKDFVSEH